MAAGPVSVGKKKPRLRRDRTCACGETGPAREMESVSGREMKPVSGRKMKPVSGRKMLAIYPGGAYNVCMET